MLLIASDRSPEEEEQSTCLVASQSSLRAGKGLPEWPGTEEMGEDARKPTLITPRFTLFYPVTSHSHALVLYIHLKKKT